MTSKTIKILVVDDHTPNRIIYRAWLTRIEGVEVVEAGGARQALELARSHDFAMALVDVNMPDIDGFELAARLRLEPRSGATPIVFATAEATDRHQILRGYRIGAVDFMLAATVHGEILVQKARVFIDLFRQRQQLQAAVEVAQRNNRALYAWLDGIAHRPKRLAEPMPEA